MNKGAPVFVARLRVTNGGGTFDSLNPAPGGEQGRIRFSVKRSLSDAANTAKIEVFNLSPDTVAKITGVVRTRINWTPEERAELLAKGASAAPIDIIADGFGLATVELAWGYTDSMAPNIPASVQLGFIGQSNSIREIPSGTDRILTIEAEDAGHLLGAGEVVQIAGGGQVPYRNKSYAVGTKLVDILVDLVHACGLAVDKQRLDESIQQVILSRGIPPGDLESGSYVASGPALPQLRQLLGALALRWSIQDGELLVLGDDSVLLGVTPLELRSDLGNILGQPRLFEADRLSIETWANAEARPGRQVNVATRTRSASYRIEDAETSGDNYSGGSTVLRLAELQTIPGVL